HAPGRDQRRATGQYHAGRHHAPGRARPHYHRGASGPRGASEMIQRLLPFLTLIVLFVLLAIASPNFLTATNLSSVVRQTAVINIVALGMTVIIIAGGIDLSVGSILALAGLLGTMRMEQHQPIWFAMLVGIVVGTLCGLFNG